MNKVISLNDFKKIFPSYCAGATDKSGKGNSYMLAIVYLIEYLGGTCLDNGVFSLIVEKEKEILDKKSDFYGNLHSYLKDRGRGSYLDNGYISAALPHLKTFYTQNETDITKNENDGKGDVVVHCQKIFFGAPGTGKSHKVNEIVPKDDKVTFRTTFHPDYDYAQFVGSYKPVKESSVDSGNLSKDQLTELFSAFKNQVDSYPVHKFGATYWKSLQQMSGSDKKSIIAGGQDSTNTMDVELNKGAAVGSYLSLRSVEGAITYSFIPQVFANAYAAAWKDLSKPVYLVIEEINRGNCAQIFGDIFQLLDRDDDGYSCYEIDADADFAGWLSTQGLSGKLKLPPNFNILATMNTSDQSLFPMDSAFKRRFDWEYVPISFEGKSAADFKIENSKGEPYSWQAFVERINEKILDLTESEDKQLGEYFIKPDLADNVISEKRFKGKVMFYLWNEICKDEHKHGSFFKIDGKFFTFQDLYNGKANLADFIEEIVNADSEEA